MGTFATRNDLQWDVGTNTGPVLFHFARLDCDRATRVIISRGYDRTICQDIVVLVGGQSAATGCLQMRHVHHPLLRTLGPSSNWNPDHGAVSFR